MRCHTIIRKRDKGIIMTDIEDITELNLKRTPIKEFIQKKISKEELKQWNHYPPLKFKEGVEGMARNLRELHLSFYNTVNKLSEEIMNLPGYEAAEPIDAMNQYQACILAGLRWLQKESGRRPNLNHVKYKAIKMVVEKKNE